MPKQIREAAAAPVAADTPGRLLVGLITPGWGSSGYYSDQVLENAATDKVWPKGTHVYFDHPTESEKFDRPERSVRDLAAVLTEDATWDGAQLSAPADVIGLYKDLVTDPVFVEAVGMSIRAAAETTTGEADGRQGTIITRLTEGISVDLVTHAGRGGKVLAVLESARADLREATANDTSDALTAALKDANPGERVYTWVRDFDADKGVVYFVLDSDHESNTYQQGFTLADDGTAALTGDPVEVSVRTEYVPVLTDAAEGGTTGVPAPAGQSNASESKENAMATTQIEEAELGRLREDSQRVQTAESERDAANTRADNTERQLAEAHRVIDKSNARDIVRKAAREAQVELDDYQVAGIAADYPTGEDGRLDGDKLTEAAKTAVAKLAEEAGAGKVRGLGGGSGGGEISESDARAFLYGVQKGA